ncbi:MAG: hypothetical protein NUW37_16370 [Planctomycetes bacterium]|nr:hypothetical protein [Planctomycetota bacterium]
MSLKDILSKAGYDNLPAAPSSEGTIINPPADTLLPRVGVWIMPDNKVPGILEDFIRFLVPSGEARLLEHARTSIASIPEGFRRFSKEKESKVLIHTFLAWQNEPGKPMGQAITAKYLHQDVPEVDGFVRWLNALFAS